MNVLYMRGLGHVTIALNKWSSVSFLQKNKAINQKADPKCIYYVQRTPPLNPPLVYV